MNIPIRVRTDAPSRLVLEPLGEIYEIRPGIERVVLYSETEAPSLSITVDADGIKIWSEGDGFLELRAE